MATSIFKIWRFLVLLVSSEWIITKMDIPNGGAVILLRALISGVIIFFLILAFLNILDPTKSWEFSFMELRTQIIEKTTWYGVIFAAIYTALYTRFSSQWSYLANLYNSIKQTELNKGNNELVIAQWKAGFLENAENLHIACKGTFVTILKVWGEDEKVKSAFIKYTPGSKPRFEKLMEKVNFSKILVDKKYRNT